MSIRGCRVALWAAALGVAWTAAAPAFAHHSFAMFDHDHQIKLTGTVKIFQWTNPHVYILLAANEPDGRPAEDYTIECASPGILDRAGWKWNMVKVGDKVTAIIAPLKSGRAGGLLKLLTLANGKSFGNGPVAGKPNIH